MSGDNRAHNRNAGATHSAQTGNKSSFREPKKEPIVILVLGPHGCGKSHFINTIRGRDECHVSDSFQLCTRRFREYKDWQQAQGVEFRFIDSPGFGNEVFDDRRILELLVQYFAPNPAKHRHDSPNLPKRVTGVLYIHPEDKYGSNRSSQKTMEMLRKVIGDEIMNRITILIPPEGKIQVDLSNYTPHMDSPLFPLYQGSVRPRTMIYDETTQSIKETLNYYIDLNPRLIRLAAIENFVEDGNWRYEDIPLRLRELFPAEIGHQGDMKQMKSRLRDQDMELENQKAIIVQKEEEIRNLQSTHEAEKAKIEELQNRLLQQEDIRSLQTTCNAHARRDKSEELKTLLAQKENELEVLRATYQSDQETFRTERKRETFNHEIKLKSLQSKIEDRGLEISKLKANNEELQKLGAAKDEQIERLGLEIEEFKARSMAKDAKLMEVENTKTKEISELASDKNSKIKELQDLLDKKEEELEKLKANKEGGNRKPTNGAQFNDNKTARNPANANANGTTTKHGSEKDSEIERLNMKLDQVKAEYASLRTNMQLEENTEQGHITTALSDINRLIDELGSSLSEHIEKYMEEDRSQTNFQQRDLFDWFGQTEDHGQLLSGAKQDPYVLFEYAIQATICKQLCTHLFMPFHPSIADDDKCSTLIGKLYSQITYQEPQSVAGRWRKDAYKALSSLDTEPEYHHVSDSERLHGRITSALATLLEKLVDIQPQEILDEHDKALSKIIEKAEDFNRLLKGSVSQLGDFQPTLFSFGETFDLGCMSTVKIKSKKAKSPETILATVEMGLMKRVASGRGQKPEETILRKAVVFGLAK